MSLSCIISEIISIISQNLKRSRDRDYTYLSDYFVNLKANTLLGQPVYKNLNSIASAVPEIFLGGLKI